MKDVYLTIIESINATGKLPDLNISKQARNRYIRKLKADGIIQKIGYGVWKVTSKPMDVGKPEGRIRGHGFVFKVKLPKIYNWHKREQYLRKNSILFQKIKQGQRIILRGHKVWLCDDCLVIYYSKGTSFYGSDPKTSCAYAVIEAKKTIQQIESMLKVDFLINKNYMMTETRSHYAEIRNELAKIYRERGVNKFEIKQDGRVWALIDNSFNLHEFEAVAGAGQSKDDMRTVQRFFNTIRDNPKLIDEINDIQEIKALLKETVEIVKSNAYLMQEHLKKEIL